MTLEGEEITIRMAPDLAAALRYVAARRGVPLDEPIAHAIAADEMILRAQEQGNAVVIHNGRRSSGTELVGPRRDGCLREPRPDR